MWTTANPLTPDEWVKFVFTINDTSLSEMVVWTFFNQECWW